MDRLRFDTLTRLLATTGSRRSALGALLGAALLGTAPDLVAGRGKGGKGQAGRKGRGKGKDRKSRRKTQAEQVPADCFPNSRCTGRFGAQLARCDFGNSNTFENGRCIGCNLNQANFQDADASGVKFSAVNLGGACLVDADFSGGTFLGVNTLGAIFCRTIMPNGMINNSGCNRPTPCCPTCIEEGEACGAGIGGVCCSGLDCEDGACRTAGEEFILSGGTVPTAAIFVDDDLRLELNGQTIFNDNDGFGGFLNPIVPTALPGDHLRVVAINGDSPNHCIGLDPLYLHRTAGGPPQVLDPAGVTITCDVPAGVFYDQTFTIAP
jgi:hypothetical protein